MATLGLIIAILLAIGLTTASSTIGLCFLFSDLIVAGLIIYLIVKLIKKSKNK